MSEVVKFGKYILLERIGSGGTAEVFRALCEGAAGVRRTLALKRMLSHLAAEECWLDMLQDEARTVSQLQHPNIVRVTDLGRVGKQHYLDMEYVGGKDLAYLLCRLRDQGDLLPVHIVVHLALQIAQALDYAHTKTSLQGAQMGIVHRDVSPHNVLLSFEGDVKLTDFGIAKAKDRISKTSAGIIKGKLNYMAPEQIMGGEITPTTDIFALGLLLYEMLSGIRLLNSDLPFEILDRLRDWDPAAIEPLPEQVPEGLRNLVMQALQPDQSQRQQSAEQVQEQLATLLLQGTRAVSSRQLAEYLGTTLPAELDAELKAQARAARVPAKPKRSQRPHRSSVARAPSDEQPTVMLASGKMRRPSSSERSSEQPTSLWNPALHSDVSSVGEGATVLFAAGASARTVVAPQFKVSYSKQLHPLNPLRLRGKRVSLAAAMALFVTMPVMTAGAMWLRAPSACAADGAATDHPQTAIASNVVPPGLSAPEWGAIPPRAAEPAEPTTSPQLDLQSALLSVVIDAQNCIVRLGSRHFGVAPVYRKETAAGWVPLRVWCPGRGSYRQRFRLEPGEHRTVSVAENQLAADVDAGWRFVNVTTTE